MLDARQGCNHAAAKPWTNITFDVKSGEDTPFGNLVWCPDCHRGFTTRMPTDAEIAQHYDLESYYTQGNSSHMPDVKPTLADRILTKLAWTFDDPPAPLPDTIAEKCPNKGRLLDIGCGKGALMADAKARGFEVAGVEPDPAARQAAAKDGMIASDGTAEHLPPEITGETFDVVTTTHVLEHCISPRKALENARKCLRRDGTLYCEVPNCGALYFQRNVQISEMLDVPRHLHFFTKDSLQMLCDAVGLKITDWRYHGYTRHYKAAWRAWENSIHQRIKARGETPEGPNRSFARSLKLILDTAKAAPDKKFDCIGFFATPA